MTLANVAVLLAALVVVISTKTVQAHLNDIVTNNYHKELNPRMIRVRDALEGEFPWMVALHYKGRFLCSSFLVAPKVLMTAAHCLVFGGKTEDPKNYKGYVGTVARDGVDNEITFTEIIVHSEYGSGTEYDIAIMKLAQPVETSDNVQIICLPPKDSTYDDVTAQVIGWGVSEKGGRISSETLQIAIEKVPLHSLCILTYSFLSIPISRRHVCAGGERGKGICSGDSGGPLVAMDDNNPVAIGVSSFGSFLRCGVNRVPVVYTAISMYTDWIVENTGDDANDLCFVNITSTNTR